MPAELPLLLLVRACGSVAPSSQDGLPKGERALVCCDSRGCSCHKHQQGAWRGLTALRAQLGSRREQRQELREGRAWRLLRGVGKWGKGTSRLTNQSLSVQTQLWGCEASGEGWALAG